MGVSSFFIPYNVLREMGSPMMLLKMMMTIIAMMRITHMVTMMSRVQAGVFTSCTCHPRAP